MPLFIVGTRIGFPVRLASFCSSSGCIIPICSGIALVCGYSATQRSRFRLVFSGFSSQSLFDDIYFFIRAGYGHFAVRHLLPSLFSCAGGVLRWWVVSIGVQWRRLASVVVLLEPSSLHGYSPLQHDDCVSAAGFPRVELNDIWRMAVRFARLFVSMLPRFVGSDHDDYRSVALARVAVIAHYHYSATLHSDYFNSWYLIFFHSVFQTLYHDDVFHGQLSFLKILWKVGTKRSSGKLCIS